MVEPEKWDQTALELSDRFNGFTQDVVRVRGLWKHAGVAYHDDLIRYRLDTGDEKARPFLRQYKATLKVRFGQLDIWITAHEIEII